MECNICILVISFFFFFINYYLLYMSSQNQCKNHIKVILRYICFFLVSRTGEELHQEIPTLQLTNTDVICSTPFSDLGNYEVVCSVSPLQLMTQTRTPPNPHSSCTATADESKSSDPYQYVLLFAAFK